VTFTIPKEALLYHGLLTPFLHPKSDSRKSTRFIAASKSKRIYTQTLLRSASTTSLSPLPRHLHTIQHIQTLHPKTHIPFMPLDLSSPLSLLPKLRGLVFLTLPPSIYSHTSLNAFFIKCALYFTVFFASGSLERVPARRDGVLDSEEHPLLTNGVLDEPKQNQLLCDLYHRIRQCYLQRTKKICY
jgi:hypothetical protein